MDRRFAAICIQSRWRTYLIRTRVVLCIQGTWERVYDPRRHRFYYYDTQRRRSQWRKPRLLGRCDIERISPTYSPSQAAILIQRQVRRFVAVHRAAVLYAGLVQLLADEQYNYEYWYNPRTEYSTWELPRFLQSQAAVIRQILTGKEDVSPHNGDNEFADSDGSGSDSDGTLLTIRDRRYPRSKMQLIVDEAEDHPHETQFLNLSGFNANSISSRIWNLSKVEKLDLSHNKLNVLKNDVANLVNLTELDLSHNCLQTIPDEIGELNNLRALRLSHNKLSSYSANIYCLPHLTSFDVSYNMLSTIPVEIGNLDLLKRTHQWEIGPGLLQTLETFDASYNALIVFPLQIEQCSNLQYLNLSNNQLKEIPERASQLTSLIELDVSKNCIEDYLAQVSEMSSLQSLNVANNLLTELPPLRNDQTSPVRTIDISHNKLSIILQDVGRWTSLTSLRAHHNNIVTITDGIAKLKNLTELDLRNNAIETLPVSIRDIFRVQWVDLSWNHLRVFPSQFGTAGKLETLQLSHNSISALPASIVNFTALTSLDLSFNELSEIPVEILELSALTQLDLQHNAIEDIPNISTRQWVTLRELNLSFNRLQILPDSYLYLQRLHTLDLQHNDLSEFPSDMANIRALRRLYLSHNKIQENLACLLSAPLLLHCNWSFNKYNLKTTARSPTLQMILASLPVIEEALWNLPSLYMLDVKDAMAASNFTVLEWRAFQQLDSVVEQLTKFCDEALPTELKLTIAMLRLTAYLKRVRFVTLISRGLDLRSKQGRLAVIDLENEDIADISESEENFRHSMIPRFSSMPPLKASSVLEDMLGQRQQVATEAIKLYVQCDKLIECRGVPACFRLPYHLGFAYLLRVVGKSAEAITHLHEVIRANPLFELAYIDVIKCMLACGQCVQAVEYCTQMFCKPTAKFAHGKHFKVAMILQHVAQESYHELEKMHYRSTEKARAFKIREDDVCIRPPTQPIQKPYTIDDNNFEVVLQRAEQHIKVACDLLAENQSLNRQ